MAKKTKKSSKRKAKSNSKKTLSVILTILVIILFASWYLFGKPYLVQDEQGLMLVMTEEPIINLEKADSSAGVLRQAQEPHSPVVEPVGAESNSVGSESNSVGAETNPVVPEAESVVPEPKTGVPEPVEGKNKNISSASADLGHAEDSPLFFGNPSDAFADTKLDTNYLMVKPQFTLSYNTSTLCPNWVAWHLDSVNMGDADRSDDFRPDTELPQGWYGVKKADYQYNKYGFDRGHVCPSADRTATKEDNSMTFLMTNMVPQTPDNNRLIWMHFENFERELVKEGNEVYIIAGPYGTGGTSPKGTFDNIPIQLKSGETFYMNVPAYTWKVLIALPTGDGDLDRMADSSATAIAINVPNKTGMQKTGDWEQFLCSIDEIEAMTGYDFFELLPDDIEDALEASVYQR